MNQEDIIRFARIAMMPYEHQTKLPLYIPQLTQFAALVAAHEREACAKVCEELLRMVSSGDEHMDGVTDCIDAIRARGNVREHVMSGDCWCNPELNYTDPETGAEVWVHKEPQ